MSLVPFIRELVCALHSLDVNNICRFKKKKDARKLFDSNVIFFCVVTFVSFSIMINKTFLNFLCISFSQTYRVVD